MKCTKIYYQKCFNLGNYQNEVIGVEICPTGTENAEEMMNAAKAAIERFSMDYKKKKEHYENVVKNSKIHIVGLVDVAEQFLKDDSAELPF